MLERIKNLLNHEDVFFTEQENCIKVTNPVNGDVIAYVKKTSKEKLEELIEKARLAQIKWKKETSTVRADILFKWYNLFLENADDLAYILTLEQGKSLTEARNEIVYAASFIRWFAEECRRVEGDIMQNKKDGQRALVLKQPIGVTAAITPWNFPSAMIARKAGPALAVGCSMLVKSASATPLSAYASANLAYQAGVPKDVLAVVNGDSGLISDIFCTHEVIRKISFTGSTEVGRLLMRKSADNIKKLSLELGGNAPFIVFDDADIDKAVSGAIASKYRNSGQTCVCANRIYVQAGIYDKFASKLSDAVSKQIVIGNGLDEGVNQGPLIDSKAVSKIEEHISDATSKGAKVILGGNRHEFGGNFFEPTILANVDGSMLVAKEETFGPLAPLFKFETEEEVIKLANDTEYGLAAYFFTNDYKRQWRVGEALEYGMVGVNTGLISTEITPFGGVKQSGIGREGSRYGINEYLDIKYLCLDLSE